MISAAGFISWPMLLYSFLGYVAALSFYRILLSPLSKFPGPKLAALSDWYEIYYDVWNHGRFTFKIQELHQKYGMLQTLRII